MRKVNKTLKKRNIKKRNIKKIRYLGGTKYIDDENFLNAHKEISNRDPIDNTIYWLKKAKEEHEDDEDIQLLIEKLNESKKLLDEVRERIAELVDQ